MKWRPGDPLPLPVRRSVPAPGPGQALLYVDALTGEPMVARRGAGRARLAPAAETSAAPSSSTTVQASLQLDGGIAGRLASATVTVAGAQTGQLAQVGYGASIPDQVAGAPFARVTAADTVTVTVPLAATLGTVTVPVIVTVAS